MNTIARLQPVTAKTHARQEALALFQDYQLRLQQALNSFDWGQVATLGEWLWKAWQDGRRVFVCGNGGSAANACHIANDLLYGIDKPAGEGLAIEALSANTAVLTCLANDTGYDNIFAQQLKVKARKGDILIVLSGSGNSPNVVNALEIANQLGLKTAAILGYSGGACKQKAQLPLHFAVDDMQISEDVQLMIGHMLMRWLASRNGGEPAV